MNFHSPQSATSTRLVYTFKHIKLSTTFLDSLFDGPTYTTRSSSFWPAQSLEPNDKHQHAFQPRWSGLVVIDPVAAGPQWQGGSDSWVPLGRIYELSDPMVQRLLVQCRCWSSAYWSSAGAGPVAAGPQWQGGSDSWVPLGRIHEISDPMVQWLLVQCCCWSSGCWSSGCCAGDSQHGHPQHQQGQRCALVGYVSAQMEGLPHCAVSLE
jgi:hypothetical protein